MNLTRASKGHTYIKKHMFSKLELITLFLWKLSYSFLVKICFYQSPKDALGKKNVDQLTNVICMVISTLLVQFW